MAKNMVITISRQYGAGGRSVARALSDKFSIPFYDKDFVRKTAQTSGYSEEAIQREGEAISRSGSVLNTILPAAASDHDAIFQAQKKVILELAKEPCIIIGRCSNIILKEAGIDSFNVFLYADMDHRMKRARELGEFGEEDLRNYVNKRETQRETYYRTFTGREMADCRNYDICLNTGALGYDLSVEVLFHTVEDRMRQEDRWLTWL